jgi:hypothetical protein
LPELEHDDEVEYEVAGGEEAAGEEDGDLAAGLGGDVEEDVSGEPGEGEADGHAAEVAFGGVAALAAEAPDGGDDAEDGHEVEEELEAADFLVGEVFWGHGGWGRLVLASRIAALGGFVQLVGSWENGMGCREVLADVVSVDRNLHGCGLFLGWI